MRRILYLSFALDLVIFDQISKWLASEFFIKDHIFGGHSSPLGPIEWFLHTPERLPYAEIPLLPFLNLVMVWNEGVSFGMMEQSSDTGRWLLIALSLIIVLWFSTWLFRTSSRVQSIGIAMVIGGALGNIIDRLRFGAVIDFIDFHIGAWHYPAFNVADSCICLGVGLLIIYALFFERQTERR